MAAQGGGSAKPGGVRFTWKEHPSLRVGDWLRLDFAAKAHADLARELETRGTGSRLNRLRAEQELSTDEGLIESARLALYRAQEVLGVLVVANGPVDAADEPTFDLPFTPTSPGAASTGGAPGTVMQRSAGVRHPGRACRCPHLRQTDHA